MSSKRIEWVDRAKGIGVILVILGHMNLGDDIMHWIYSFHMPLFFFLSGYVFRANIPFGPFVKKKAKALLVPYVCLGLPMLAYVLWQSLRDGYYSSQLLLEWVIKFALQQRLWSLWFLTCLFLLELMAYWICRVKNQVIMVLISMIMLMLGLWYYKNGGQPLIWNMDLCFTTMVFFVIGYLSQKNIWLNHELGEIIKDVVQTASIGFLGLIVNVVCSKISVMQTGESLMLSYTQYGSSVFTYVGAFAGILFVICFAKMFRSDAMKYVGQNSWIYFAWNQTILLPAILHFFEQIHYVEPVREQVGAFAIYRGMEFVLVIAISTIFTIIVSNTRLKFMIGK